MANKKYFTDESLATLVDETKTYTDNAVSGKANSSHTHSISNVTNLQSSLDAKVPNTRTVNGKALSANITLSASDVGAADSSHTHSSYVNQNAFSNVKVGTTTVAADTTTDTLEIAAGTGISITGDATNDKVTIINSGVHSIESGSSNGTISVNTNGTATNVAVKGLGSAAYTASTAYDAAGTAQTKADAALASAKTYTDGKIDAIVGEGASETLNTIGEISAAIEGNQNMIDTLNSAIGNKADKSHNHDDSYYTESEIDSKVNTLNTAINGKAAKSTTLAGYGITDAYTKTQVDSIASNYLPLSGGSLNNASTLKLTQYGCRHLTIDGNSLNFDLSQDTGGWVISLANIYDATKTNTTMLGAFGGTSGVNWIYMGGSYDNPHFKITSDGTSYFNKTPYVGSTAVSLEGHTHSYNNLTDKPTIPSVGNGTITIKQNGVSKGTFTVNQSSNTTIELADTNTDTNTHYTTGITAGASGTTINSATANPYVKVKDDSTHRSQIQIVGSGATSVTSDANGVITIKSTDTNTAHNHSTGVGLVGSGSTGVGGDFTYKAKLRSETALTVDSAAATTTSGRVYPVAVDKTGYLAVNVPWTDTNTVYTHPTHTAKSSGLYKITVDGNGHVSAATAVAKSDITALGIPAQDTVYTLPAATSSALGGVKIGSNITNSSGTISLTKANVTAALGYTPPTSDTNTTYSAGTGISLSGTTFSNSGVRSIATGSANGTISVNTNGTATNVAVKGLGSAAYTASTAYATAAQGTLADNALPKAGGTITGNLTVNGSTYFKSSCYMPNALGYNGYQTDGAAVNLVYVSSDNNINLGTMGNYPHSGNTYVNSKNGSVYLQNKLGQSVYWSGSSSSAYSGAFMPTEDGKPYLGGSSHRWNKVYAASGSIATSDEREKSDIMSIADYPVMYSRNGNGNILEQLFDKLVPKTYTLDIETNKEMHIGFIAQDIVNAMEELGLTEEDLSLIDHDYWTDEETGEEKDRYGLAYDEFIALNTYIIQKQKERIITLEERVTQLEELVSAN